MVRSFIKKVKSSLSHFNYVHCGVEILNMSKRIMNKVFSCADDLNINIYYQDTDSIHLNYGDVGKIVERYKDTYDVNLVGKDLVNLHVDVDLYGATSEICAIECLFLGENTYIYILEPIGEDVKTINSSHIRMKGIPTSCTQYYAEQHNITVF